jgi:hypothetical protein
MRAKTPFFSAIRGESSLGRIEIDLETGNQNPPNPTLPRHGVLACLSRSLPRRDPVLRDRLRPVPSHRAAQFRKRRQVHRTLQAPGRMRLETPDPESGRCVAAGILAEGSGFHRETIPHARRVQSAPFGGRRVAPRDPDGREGPETNSTRSKKRGLKKAPGPRRDRRLFPGSMV